MTSSLEAFHFNARKSGQIFKQLCKERGISRASLAAQSGLSYDTVDNCLKGRNELSFERVFKFCVVLGLPIEAYMMLMLQDEDIDFNDEVLLYDIAKGDSTAISEADVSPVPASVPNSVSDAAAAATVPATPPQPPCAGYSREEMQSALERQERCHAEHLADLRDQISRQDQIIRQLISAGRG